MKNSKLFHHLVLVAAVSLLSGMAQADLGTKRRVCMTCHQIEGKLTGPAFKDVASRYKGKPNAVDALTQKILGGSKGVWGDQVMPPNTYLSQAEAKKLADWVLEQ